MGAGLTFYKLWNVAGPSTYLNEDKNEVAARLSNTADQAEATAMNCEELSEPFVTSKRERFPNSVLEGSFWKVVQAKWVKDTLFSFLGSSLTG